MNDTSPPHITESHGPRVRGRKLAGALGVFAALVAAAGIALSTMQGQISSLQNRIDLLAQTTSYPGDTLAASLQPDHFQAVFLSSGQVYFGHLTITHAGDYQLTDIYYLDNNSATPGAAGQGGSTADGASGIVTDPSSGPSLIKLGNELHRPEDAMFIPRASVEFWENLQSDALQGQLR